MSNAEQKLPITILCVEDEDVVRRRIGELLALKVQNVRLAANGQEGLEIYNEVKPDVIVTDIRMPKMNGLEMLKEIRKTDQETPCIITTAHNESEYLIDAIALGVNQFLLKPISVEKFFNAIEKSAELIKAKKELIKERKFLQQYKYAIDQSSIFSRADLQGNILYANDKFCERSGYTIDELLGKAHNIVRHPNNPKAVFKDLWDTIEAKQIWRGTVENRAKSGESYWVKATIIPILDEDDNITEYISIRQDVTDLILKERELEAMRIEQMKSSVEKALVITEEEIINDNPFAAIAIDESDNILCANKPFRALLESNGICESLLDSSNVKITGVFEEQGALAGYDASGLLDWKENALGLGDDDFLYIKDNEYMFKMIKLSSGHFIIALTPNKESWGIL